MGEAVANSLEEAGDRLFTFARLPLSQWCSARTTSAIERLHGWRPRMALPSATVEAIGTQVGSAATTTFSDRKRAYRHRGDQSRPRVANGWPG
jgi:hypothetical protein